MQSFSGYGEQMAARTGDYMSLGRHGGEHSLLSMGSAAGNNAGHSGVEDVGQRRISGLADPLVLGGEIMTMLGPGLAAAWIPFQ